MPPKGRPGNRASAPFDAEIGEPCSNLAINSRAVQPNAR
jgi:hypothetical protein